MLIGFGFRAAVQAKRIADPVCFGQFGQQPLFGLRGQCAERLVLRIGRQQHFAQRPAEQALEPRVHLSNFSRYCYVYYNLITGPSNLSFQLTCTNDNEMLKGDTVIYTNVTSASWDKMKHMGLYAEYTAEDLHIDTNMSQIPTYIEELASGTEFFEQSFLHFIISVDTNFPYADA